jgi:uncharacterized NAD(P)/FAD-binding protein YdhS
LWEISAVPEIVTQADRAAQSLACLYEAMPAVDFAALHGNRLDCGRTRESNDAR